MLNLTKFVVINFVLKIFIYINDFYIIYDLKL